MTLTVAAAPILVRYARRKPPTDELVVTGESAEGRAILKLVTPRGEPFGCVVAVKGPRGIQYGWSLCHKGDAFNRKKARMIAYNRAIATKCAKLPDSLVGTLGRLLIDAGRYFASPKRIAELEEPTPDIKKIEDRLNAAFDAP